MAQQPQQCPNCHSVLPSGATFCGSCGSSTFGGFSGTFSVEPPPPPGIPSTSYGTYDQNPYQIGGIQPVMDPTVYPSGGIPSRRGNNIPPSNPRKSRTALFVILGLVILVIIGSIVGLTANNNYQATLNTNATATAQSNASDQATAQVVTAKATANAQATASAIALMKNPYAAMNNLVIDDSFARQNARWIAFSESDRSCAFLNGGFTLSVSASPPLFCDDQQTAASFTDVTVEAQMNITNGDCGGIRVRDQATTVTPNVEKHYNFFVCSDGSYFFYKGSTILKQGTAAITSNTVIPVAVVAQGNVFKLFIAGKEVDTATDQNNSYQSGDIGIVAGKISSNTMVVYTHIRVWTP